MNSQYETPNKKSHRTFQRNYCYGCNQSLGPRGKQEDAVAVQHDDRERLAYFAVFDGHCGRFAADCARERLCEMIVSKPSFQQGHALLSHMKVVPFPSTQHEDFDDFDDIPALANRDVVQASPDGDDEDTQFFNNVGSMSSPSVSATQHTGGTEDIDYQRLFASSLIESFVQLNAYLLENDPDRSGTTASVAFVLDAELVVCANVGDSSIVLFPRAPMAHPNDFVRLSCDHRKPNDGDMDIELSRSLGDPKLNLSCEPDVFFHNVNFQTDGFLVIASDGVWDRFTMSEVDATVRSALMDGGDPQVAAHRLTEQAVTVRLGQDNATAIVVAMQKLSSEEGCSCMMTS